MLHKENQIEGFEDKVNFVDENNVFLGYDLTQDCCEYADWFISKETPKIIPKEPNQDEELLKDYKFVNTYIKHHDVDHEDKKLDERPTTVVSFKIRNNVNDELYINLFNNHNGYYTHGFEYNNNDSRYPTYIKDNI